MDVVQSVGQHFHLSFRAAMERKVYMEVEDVVKGWQTIKDIYLRYKSCCKKSYERVG